MIRTRAARGPDSFSSAPPQPSDRDLQGDLAEQRLRRFRPPALAGSASRHPDEPVALQQPQVLLHVLEIPSNSAGERIYGTGTLGPDRAQERQTVRREELAGGLDAREEDLLPALHPGLASGRSFQGLERLAERRHRLAERLDPDRQCLGHFVPPITRRTSDAKSAKRPSTSKNLYGSSTSSTCRWCPFGSWLSYNTAGVCSPRRMNARRYRTRSAPWCRPGICQITNSVRFPSSSMIFSRRISLARPIAQTPYMWHDTPYIKHATARGSLCRYLRLDPARPRRRATLRPTPHRREPRDGREALLRRARGRRASERDNRRPRAANRESFRTPHGCERRLAAVKGQGTLCLLRGSNESGR